MPSRELEEQASSMVCPEQFGAPGVYNLMHNEEIHQNLKTIWADNEDAAMAAEETAEEPIDADNEGAKDVS